MHNRRQDFPNIPGSARFIGGLFGFVFLGIGLTVIGFLWSQPFGRFGSPPLIFRIFGSFIAIAFVGMGGITALGAISGKSIIGRKPGSQHTGDDAVEADEADASDNRSGGYACHHCGAPLGDGADVSPHGDVKCKYCKSWFNIHG